MSKLNGRALQLFALILGLATVAYATPPKIEAVPGEFVVRLKPNMMTTMSQQSLSSELGAFVKSAIPSQNIVVVKRPVFENRSSAIQALSANSLVDIVEPNLIYHATRLPDDPLLGNLW